MKAVARQFTGSAIDNRKNILKNKPTLEFNDVNKILAGAQAEAKVQGWAVTIAVVDDGGHLLGLSRLDGAPAISAQLAPAKATTPALGKRESKFYEEILNNRRNFMLSIAPALGVLLEGESQLYMTIM